VIERFENIVDKETVDLFLQFLNQPDQYVDDRGDVYNKLMTPDIDAWPQATVRKILDQVFDEPYTIENADFVRIRFISRLHTDTGNGDQTKLHKNVIIPLEVNEHGASTAVFDNMWYGPAVRFTRTPASPFRYAMPDVLGTEVLVEDIRDLLQSIKNSNTEIINYQGNGFAISMLPWLEDLVEKRNNAEPRVSDYSGISDLTTAPFPEDFRQQWLDHIPSESLQGLTVPNIVPWQVGDVITFDRQHVHCGTSQLQGYKSFLAVFTYRG
jgi:hypothetical protein